MTWNGVPENAANMPLICQSWISALQDVVVAARALPRQRIREGELEIVRAIEPGDTLIAIEFTRNVPHQRRSPVLVVSATCRRLRRRSSAGSFIALLSVYAPLNKSPR